MKTLFIVALTLGLAACSDNNNNSVGPIDSFAGEYALQTLNGSPLPYTFTDGTTLTSDVVTLFSDGTFSESIQLADGSVFVDQGFYSVSNGSVTFNDQTIGVTYPGTLSGSTLTEVFSNGLTAVYQRR